MCIRDRIRTGRRGQKPLGMETVLHPLAFLDRSEDLAAYGFCLLYTSDAADERSSVDLGGRRIIKKKKDTTL